MFCLDNFNFYYLCQTKFFKYEKGSFGVLVEIIEKDNIVQIPSETTMPEDRKFQKNTFLVALFSL